MSAGIDTRRYLERLAGGGRTHPDLDTLRRLHRQHLLHVPFENLDIHRGRPLSLDEAALFEKIVVRHRGGFCYELNTLFAALLREIGFRVDTLSARVVGEDGRLGPPFDHMALLVHLDQRWLVDVGFGDSFLDPLSLDAGGVHVEGGVEYRILDPGGSDPARDLSVQRKFPSSEWATQYTFTLEPRRIEEFEPMCRFHQTSPQSPFPKRRVCTKATPFGRITLSERRLIETVGDYREEIDLTSESQWEEILRSRFGIVLEEANRTESAEG
jgi:N-hydroxyarylamine O-acetyltransferase